MRIRRTIALAGALALLGAAPVAAEPPPGTTAEGPTAFAQPRVVTLITGDRVRATAPDTFVFEPAAGRENVGYTTRTVWNGDDRDVVVMPADAAALVAAGTLDPRLFEVSRLLRDGVGDALPLIVRYAEGARRTFAAADTRALPAVDAEALTVTAGQAASMWDRITGKNPRALTGGVEKIWLDARSRVLLDQSVPQVGAPVAWEAGYTGAGVTVAVLDTGYDPTHPDLNGRVTEARDFTDSSPGAIDGDGHGTHVASTVAGTGAASNGKYKGVAPDVKLLVGKVCDDGGSCEDSDIIAGMQWAADQGATAVNLSLGGRPTDGTDPLSLALEELTATTGTLFVAAGNSGAPGTVSSPASADAALAVGSVTKSDALSDFSSQGPRVGDGAVKPDIAAPGSSITAARAAGTGGEGSYVTADGTSMATPHVTGAAAILKQRHPDWSGPRLKSALMGASAGLDGLGAFQIGAGRLDLGRAVAQDVVADSASVSFPLSAFPHDEVPPAQTVTYRNTSDADVTLDVTVTGQVEGLFAVDSPTLLVPAGGSADLAVTAAPGGKPDGAYGGALIATAPGIAVRTALGIYLEPEMHDLTLDAEPRQGAIDYLYAAVFNVDTYQSYEIAEWDAEGNATIRVPPAHYAVFGGLVEGGAEPSQTSFADDLDLTGDRTVTWDAADARLNGVELDHDDAVSWSGSDVMVATDPEFTRGHNVTLTHPAGAKSYSRGGEFPGPNSWYLRDERLVSPEGAAEAYSYDLTFSSQGRVPEGEVRRVADSELAEVDTTYAAQGPVKGSVQRSDSFLGVQRGVFWFQYRDQDVPGRRTEYFTPGQWLSIYFQGVDGRGEEFERRAELAVGASERSWNSAPLNLALNPHFPSFLRGEDLFRLEAGVFNTAERGMFGGSGGGEGYPSSTVVLADGVEIFRGSEACYAFGDLPADFGGTVTLACDSERDVPWSTIGTAASAEWTLAVRPGEAVPGMSAVRLDASGVTDGYASAKSPQIVALEVYEQTGAEDTDTKSLTFEVSYDEGKTWKKVTVYRHGDHAAALLRHPAGATSVSTRLSAVDVAGNSVTQTMIRSYGLK